MQDDYAIANINQTDWLIWSDENSFAVSDGRKFAVNGNIFFYPSLPSEERPDFNCVISTYEGTPKYYPNNYDLHSMFNGFNAEIGESVSIIPIKRWYESDFIIDAKSKSSDKKITVFYSDYTWIRSALCKLWEFEWFLTIDNDIMELSAITKDKYLLGSIKSYDIC